jgi:hypothetical protein
VVANTEKMAWCRNQNAKQNVWWFHCSSRPDCSEIYLFTIPSHSWWVKRRFVSRCYHDATTRLMKVALPAVGVMDMLRYHTFTAGAGWAYDYGTRRTARKCLVTSKAILRTQCKREFNIQQQWSQRAITMIE